MVEADEDSGELVVGYSGDPEPYVDCGWIIAYEGDDLDRLPAARSNASFRRRRDGQVVTLDRDLRLNVRMSVHVEESDEDTIVRTVSTYVLTKAIESDEAEQPLHTETISFQTGGSAAFSSGTTCQANGELERLVFRALPSVSLAGG